jgi:antitoxin component of RelBE/YafQ-DinJ toxin-antitoxin module
VKMPRVKKARLNMRLDPSLLEEAKTIAKKKHLTVTGLVEALLITCVTTEKLLERRNPLDAESV